MAWDKGEPHEGILAPDLNDVLRDNNDALEAALDAWIRFETGGTQSGQPRQGSARPYFQDSAPTARLDGEYFDSTDLGTVWIDTNATPDNQFNILTAADGAGTETWTPISTEAIAILVAQINTWALAQTFSATAVFSVPPTFTLGAVLNNAYLTAKNAAGDGTVDLMKADGSDVPTVPDDTANATSGAPTADASLANKKYVDDQIAAKTQTSQATGTDDITNNTGNWADMDDMEITITTTGGNVLLMFSAPFYYNAENWKIGLRIDVDGTPTSTLAMAVQGGVGVDTGSCSLHWLETSLAAGEHTFKVQWKDLASVAGQRGSADGPRVFTAVELP